VNRSGSGRGGDSGLRNFEGAGVIKGRASTQGLIVSIILMFSTPTHGAEAGHYQPGVWNIRDWSVPDKGWYFMQYNTWYGSNDLKDANQESAGNVPIKGSSASVHPDVHSVMFVPTFLWSSGATVAGGDFAMLISPTFGSTSLANRLYDVNSRRDFRKEQWGAGDMLVQPLRLTWRSRTDSFTLAYGFYAPVGTYSAGSPGNVGLGFWGHQFSGSVYSHPKSDQTTLMFTAVYEVNTARSGTTDTPGGHIGLEYGVSQYLGKRVELGVAGFNYFQVSDDRGADAVSPTTHEKVYGLGPQGTLWILAGRLSLAFRMLLDYDAKSRFDGSTANLTLTYVFRSPK